MVRSQGYGIPCFREPFATKADLPIRMLEQVQRARGGTPGTGSLCINLEIYLRVLLRLIRFCAESSTAPLSVPAFSHCQGNCDRRTDAASSFNSQIPLSSSWKERPRSPLESVAERYFGLELGLNEIAIKKHRRHVMKKMNAESWPIS